MTLTHLQNNLSISFAALGYKLSEQIMYRYRLKGFQNNWQTLHCTNNEIFFSNLPYNSYKLEVQLSTDRGYTWQTPGKQLEIVVFPPWYLSGWAKTLYVVSSILIVSIAFWQYNKEQKLKKENEIQKMQIKQDEDMYQAKMQFFMNASHELKTPLTLISLITEKLANENNPDKGYNTILYNVNRMLTLISELVDIRKQDLGIKVLSLSHLNISQIVRQIFEEIKIWAENKQIDIIYDTEISDIEMDADKERIGKMILNLFSNAIKYTNKGGQIEISLKRGTQKDIHPCYETTHIEGAVSPEIPICILTVKDTGIGISSESIHLIYERFFQVKGTSSTHLGAGIGLAIVKSVVLMHKGMIIVSSERMKGTEFIIALPIHEELKETQNSEEKQILDVTNFITEQYNEFHPITNNNKTITEPTAENPELPILLIVEDNPELQTILKEQLSSSYNIHIADNGHSGLEKCMSIFPDIIISDVMMPKMDGIEMCRRIKNNFSVAYIPLILLTAKNAVESQIEGYESGADLYIPKPFSMKLLKINLDRLLAQRKQWFKNNTQTTILTNPNNHTDGEVRQKAENDCNRKKEVQDEIIGTEEQRKMTERLKTIIEENIDDPDLSPGQLCSILGVSRSKFYRDFKLIDGQQLSDYIRNIRLEKAAYLLVNSNLNIQEIMNKVGFINNSHFTKIFKLKYEMTPSEYKRNAR